MERKGHPIAAGIVFLFGVIPSFDSSTPLPLLLAVVMMLLAARYGLWGAIWRTLLACTIIAIPFMAAGYSQLPQAQRRVPPHYWHNHP